MDVWVLYEVLDCKPNEETGKKELDVANKRLNWRSLDPVHVDFTVLADVIHPEVIDHVTDKMIDQ